MRQSALFGGTSKTLPSDETSVNAKLLTQAGFIRKLMAGVYVFLPLGWRVLTKIENIVREEMDNIGQEIAMPALSPKEIWLTSDRLEHIDVLFQVSAANAGSRKRNDASYVLNPTHEDVLTSFARFDRASYRDFPYAVYQIQTKFRNEERPKSGLLRAREFRMKDLYSFHTDADDMRRFYDRVIDTYEHVFHRLGIGEDTYVVAASGGDFTDDFSHEFQTKCETGEDLIFYDEKTKRAFNREIAPSRAPELPTEKEMKPLEDIKGEGIIGVSALARFLKIPETQTTKTLVYVTEKGEPILAAVRGDYDINELKLARVVGSRRVTLADEKTVQRVTGAAVGYAGTVHPKVSVRTFYDDALENRSNFEVGANRTNYHTINANWERDIPKPDIFYDIKLAKEGDQSPETGTAYRVFRGSEVGNVFPLYTKFSEAFNYRYTAKDGTQQPVYMASYGIGTSRTLGVIVEKFHDENGIIWPKQIAPFHAHLLDLTKKQDATAEKIVSALGAAGFDVLLDDRTVSPGEKLKDADLIGIPVRLVLSEKTKGKIEWKERNASETRILTAAGLAKELTTYYAELP